MTAPIAFTLRRAALAGEGQLLRVGLMMELVLLHVERLPELVVPLRGWRKVRDCAARRACPRHG